MQDATSAEGMVAMELSPEAQRLSALAEKNRAKNQLGKMILLGTALAVLVAVLVNYTGTRADFNALARMGVPLDAKSLAELAPKDGDNAASLYQEANDELNERESVGRREGRVWTIRLATPSVFSSREPVPVFLRQPILDAAIEISPIADKIRKGAAMSSCVVDLQEEFPSEEGMRYQRVANPYFRVSGMTSTLCGMAHAEILDGQIDDAMRDLKLAKKVGEQFAKGYGSGSFRSWSGESIAFCTNWRNCTRTYRDVRKIVEGAAKLAEEPFVMASIKKAAAGDFPRALFVYEAAKDDPFKYKIHFRSRSDSDITDNSFLMRQATNQAVHEWRNAFEKMPEDDSNWRSHSEVFEAASGQFLSRWPANEMLVDPFLDYSRMAKTWALVLAHKRLTRVSSKLLLYRLEQKEAPDTLPDFGKDGIDPFTGKQFGYKKSGTGFLVYSIGPDELDNVANPPTKRSINDDVVYDFGD